MITCLILVTCCTWSTFNHLALPSACAGTCEGEEEVYIFIERVKKGDIRVR